MANWINRTKSKHQRNQLHFTLGQKRRIILLLLLLLIITMMTSLYDADLLCKTNTQILALPLQLSHNPHSSLHHSTKEREMYNL
ncbi:hypothetical protein Mapa_004851 [Marchantia paleacea]|nr:hypothetical protein Mapa_004851 [Marchantia paleacea]